MALGGQNAFVPVGRLGRSFGKRIAICAACSLAGLGGGVAAIPRPAPPRSFLVSTDVDRAGARITIPWRSVPTMPSLVTSGTFPQVRDSASKVGAANATPWSALVTAERRRQASVLANNHQSDPRGPGQFLLATPAGFPRAAVEVTPALVSVLVPVPESYHAGGTGIAWIASTAAIPLGRPISLLSVSFRSPKNGLGAFARAARHVFLTSRLNPCRLRVFAGCDASRGSSSPCRLEGGIVDCPTRTGGTASISIRGAFSCVRAYTPTELEFPMFCGRVTTPNRAWTAYRALEGEISSDCPPLLGATDGTARPLFCRDGRPNPAALRYLRPVGLAELEALGRAPSLVDLRRLLCGPVLQATSFPIIEEDYQLAAVVEGWKTSLRQVNVFRLCGG